jgi:tetratricopeptide (TPR) repeat protein
MKRLGFTLALLLVATAGAAQNITQPPDGDNQRSSVMQQIGPVRVTIDYNSPDVHAPDGEDRRGKIWGKLVPYGLTDLGFGTCKQCPWRAGANENTVFTFSHDVTIEGQPLKAGSYGFHLIAAAEPEEWTAIFSKNAASWGSYFYDPAEDALRVKVKPSKAEYNEWLTFEFTDRQADKATVALKWEEIQVPVHIAVPNAVDLYMTAIRNDLRNEPGFRWQSWTAAARYALDNKRYDDALAFAQAGVTRTFIGQENYQTLTTLAEAQAAKGMNAEAAVTRDKAFNHQSATAQQLHAYARQQLQKGNKAEAIRVWELNGKRFPNQWPVNVGLARAYSAQGKYKDALKYAKLAAAQAPDDVNRKAMTDAVKKLEEGKDIN